MYTILMIITLYPGKPFDVEYNTEGTMEDCMTTLYTRIEEDILYERNTSDIRYYYFCIPLLEAQGTMV